uniref:Uncharacterized protein n=1 Tax=Megaselia scalaris TaxID=36166 RepID=T1GF89_MEGSC
MRKYLKLEVDKEIAFECYTGSSITTINHGLFKSLFPAAKLSPSNIQIKVYNKNTLSIVGEILVKVSLNQAFEIMVLILFAEDRGFKLFNC